MRQMLRWVVAGGFVVAIAAFFVLFRPASTLEILIWTSGEKQNVIGPALERFNARSPSVSVGGQRYAIHARSVTVNSGEMFTHLVAKLTRGVDFPSSTGGAPTVVSPSTSDWLVQVNGEAGRQRFDVPNLKSLVRT